MDNPAQTRGSASYGFLQMTYPTATDGMNYPKDIVGGTIGNLPENINLTKQNFDLSVPFLAGQVAQELKDAGDIINADGN